MKIFNKSLFIGMGILIASIMPTQRSDAQIIGLITKVVDKVIMEIDLAVQKVQTETVFLQDAQRQLENTMSALKLSDITGVVQQEKDLYQQYYGELVTVKNAIATYQKVSDIIKKQELLVTGYKQAYALFQQDNHFTPGEISYMYSVYSGIFTESVQNLNQIYLVLSSLTLQMGDEKRLELINSAASKIDKNYDDFQRFTNENEMLSVQRSKDEAEAQEVKNFYGLP